MYGLTDRQKELYEFLKQCAKKDHVPTYREMAKHMGMKSVSNIVMMLRAMKKRGAVDYLAGQAKSVKVLK